MADVDKSERGGEFNAIRTIIFIYLRDTMKIPIVSIVTYD